MNATIKIIILEILFSRINRRPDLSKWPTVRPAIARNINHSHETLIVATVNAIFSEPS